MALFSSLCANCSARVLLLVRQEGSGGTGSLDKTNSGKVELSQN